MMTRIGWIAVVAAVGLAATAGAEEREGLDVRTGQQLSALLGVERAALDTMGPRHMEQVTTPAPESRAPVTQLTYSADWLATLPEPNGGAQFECLATALYFEARGESTKGQFAVAEVILNRVDLADYPDSVCRVVGQGCQFSYACDGAPETIRERGAYAQVARVARLMLDGAPRALTDGATHFHTRAVAPRWSRVFDRTAAIGAHLFYRQPTRIASN